MRILLVAAIFCLSLPLPLRGETLSTSTMSLPSSMDKNEGSQVEANIEAITKYVYNVYYDFNRAVNDGVFELRPQLDGHTKPRTVSFDYKLGGDFEQYLKNTIQNHFDYAGQADLYFNREGTTSWRLGADYDNFSDPSPTETFGRIPRTVTGVSTGVHFKTLKGSTLDLSARAYMENFNIPNLISGNILSNQGVDAVALYSNAFLPETSWIVRASGGFKNYPNKTILDPNPLVPKNDSVYGLVESGFVGRLSEKSTIDSAIGWLVRAYDNTTVTVNPNYTSDSFSAPVFYMRFLEQITRRDQFMVGYNYTVSDSYYTNYYLDQEIYLGIVRIIGDQILFLTRLAYDYRTYSLPFRRDDEGITASASLRYSLSKNLKLTADLRINLLASDAYDNTDPAYLISPDRPASYNAGSLGLGILATF